MINTGFSKPQGSGSSVVVTSGTWVASKDCPQKSQFGKNPDIGEFTYSGADVVHVSDSVFTERRKTMCRIINHFMSRYLCVNFSFNNLN